MPSEAEAAFSLPVNVRRLPKKGQMLLFEASKEQREQIARDYNLISIESFNAEGLVVIKVESIYSILSKILSLFLS